MSTTNNIDFMFEMAFNKKLPPFYKSIFYKDEPLELQYPNEKHPLITKDIYTVFDVPSHLNPTKKKLPLNIKLKTIKQYKGYAIDLDNYHDIETYIKDQFGRSSRQALRSGKKRLETCFDISYKMYFGTIDKDNYDSLFKAFFKMLKIRASEKGIDNKNLQHWDIYTKQIYQKILKKEASIFVIYDGDKPINISLSLHLNDVVFLFITSYDIDYSKFRLGHTNWYWLIGWFIKNNVKLVDFSKGNTTYKKRWANLEYDFEYHLFYNKSSYKSILKSQISSQKLILKQQLRDKNLNDFYYSTIDKLKRKKKLEHLKNHTFKVVEQLPANSIIEKILIQKNGQYSFLKPIIYQYLFLSSQNIDAIEIYNTSNSNCLFFVASPKEILQLLIK